MQLLLSFSKSEQLFGYLIKGTSRVPRPWGCSISCLDTKASALFARAAAQQQECEEQDEG